MRAAAPAARARHRRTRHARRSRRARGCRKVVRAFPTRPPTAMPTPCRPADVPELRRRSANLAGLARNELVECLDGPARGQRRLEIDTPSGLSATLVVDRSLDVLSLRLGGENVGWRGASGARHPVPDPEGERGLALMRSFDGFLVTCGLDHTGLPTVHGADYLKYPPRAETVHPLHGRLATSPVTLTGYGIDAAGAGCAWASAEVRQAGVFTEVLTLRRRIEIELGRPVLRVRDTVENEGYRPVPHQLLYHVNLGYPLLDADARLTGDGWELAHLLDGDGSAAVPSDDHEELVDVGATPADRFGLENAATGLACTLRTDPETLPVTAVWRAFQSGVFALGIEPQTGGGDEPLAMLGPGERRGYRLEVELGRG